jgi:hypothetical protein
MMGAASPLVTAQNEDQILSHQYRIAIPGINEFH